MPRPHYAQDDLTKALRSVGVEPGDTLFSHSNIGFFGTPAGATSVDDACRIILDAIMNVLGDDGTLIVPTFTYSFPDGRPFDPATTPSTCGVFTEFVRRHPDAHRSHDPCVSVAAIGAHAESLTRGVEQNAYGSDGFAARFASASGRICNLNLDAGSTLVHHVERELGVPYRFDKTFTGTLHVDGQDREAASTIWVRHLVEGTEAEFTILDRYAREQGLFRSAGVGRGQVGSITYDATRDLIARTLPDEPWFLTKAGLIGNQPRIPAEAS